MPVTGFHTNRTLRSYAEYTFGVAIAANAVWRKAISRVGIGVPARLRPVASRLDLHLILLLIVLTASVLIHLSHARQVLADIIVDDVTTSSAVSANHDFSHTVSGSNRLLIVAVGLDAGTSINNARYDGVNMTLLAGALHGSGAPSSQVYYMVNPPTGSNTVSVNLAGTDNITVAAISYTGVDQTTPIDGSNTATGLSTTASVTITSQIGDIVQDAQSALAGAGPPTVGGGQSQRWNEELGGTGISSHYGAGSTEPGASSVTMSWSLSESKEWATVGFNINQNSKEFVSDIVTLLESVAIGIPATEGPTVLDSMASAIGSSLSDSSLLADVAVQALGISDLDVATISEIVDRMRGRDETDAAAISESIAANVSATAQDTSGVTDSSLGSTSALATALTVIQESLRQGLLLSARPLVLESTGANVSVFPSDVDSLSDALASAILAGANDTLLLSDVTAIGLSSTELAGLLDSTVASISSLFADGELVAETVTASTGAGINDAMPISSTILLGQRARDSLATSSFHLAASGFARSDVIGTGELLSRALGLGIGDVTTLSEAVTGFFGSSTLDVLAMFDSFSAAIGSSSIDTIPIAESLATGILPGAPTNVGELTTSFLNGYHVDRSDLRVPFATFVDGQMLSSVGLKDVFAWAPGAIRLAEIPVADSAIASISASTTASQTKAVGLGSSFTEINISRDSADFNLRLKPGDGSSSKMSFAPLSFSELGQSDLNLFDKAKIVLGSTEIRITQLLGGAELEVSGSTHALDGGFLVLHLDPESGLAVARSQTAKSDVWIVSVDDGRDAVFFIATVDNAAAPTSVSASVPPVSGRYFAAVTSWFPVLDPVVDPVGPIPNAPEALNIDGCEFLVTPENGGQSAGNDCPASLVVPGGAAPDTHTYFTISETDFATLPDVESPGAILGTSIRIEAVTADNKAEEFTTFSREARLCMPYDPTAVDSVLDLVILTLDEPSGAWLRTSTSVNFLHSVACTFISRTGNYALYSPEGPWAPSTAEATQSPEPTPTPTPALTPTPEATPTSTPEPTPVPTPMPTPTPENPSSTGGEVPVPTATPSPPSTAVPATASPTPSTSTPQPTEEVLEPVVAIGNEDAPGGSGASPDPTPTPEARASSPVTVPEVPRVASASKFEGDQLDTAESISGWSIVYNAPTSAVLAALQLDDAVISRAASQITEWINPSEASADAGSAPVPVVYLDHSDTLALANARPPALAAFTALAILFGALLTVLTLVGQRRPSLTNMADIETLDQKIRRDQKLAA